MRYNINGKNVNIPDDELEKNMKILELTKEEAIQVWLEDEGYLDNEEQQALTQKAKENHITATIHQARAESKPKKKTQKERVKKEDPVKEMVIKRLAEFLSDFAENVEITNISKLISFNIGEEKYEINLIHKRKPKK